MSVYRREEPRCLTQSVDSIIGNGTQPDEIVIVKDGPLTEALDAILDEYARKYPFIKLITLEKNEGLGIALNEGLKYCSHELVARMDSDDISKPDRFEKQLEVLRNNPEIDVVGSWISEFMKTPDNVVGTRKLPRDHFSIAAYAQKRNAMNHMSVIFRKSAVLAAGGYKHFPLFEDYYLWVRMLVNGSRFANIADSLVLVRISEDMYRRRGGIHYVHNEWRLQREFRRIGFISRGEMLINMVLRTSVRLIPNGVRAFVYKKLLRR